MLLRKNIDKIKEHLLTSTKIDKKIELNRKKLNLQ